MVFGKKKHELTVIDFLARAQPTTVIDVRGSTEYDPAIPGSKRIYLLDLEDRVPQFEKRFASNLRSRPMLLYCSKGDGSAYLQKKFSREYQVESLDGGMASYLEFITRLLNDHPYQDPSKRNAKIMELLAILTSWQTPFHAFRQIIGHLIQNSPDAKIRKLL